MALITFNSPLTPPYLVLTQVTSPSSSSSSSTTSKKGVLDYLTQEQLSSLQDMTKNLGMDHLMSSYEVLYISILHDMQSLKDFQLKDPDLRKKFNSELLKELDMHLGAFEKVFFLFYRFVVQHPDPTDSSSPLFDPKKSLKNIITYFDKVKEAVNKISQELIATLTPKTSKANDPLAEKRKNLQTLSSSLQSKLQLFSTFLQSDYVRTILGSESFHLFNKQDSFALPKQDVLFKSLGSILKILSTPLSETPLSAKKFSDLIPFKKDFVSLSEMLMNPPKNDFWIQKFSQDLNILILKVSSLFHRLDIELAPLIDKGDFTLESFQQKFPEIPYETPMDIHITLHFLCDIQRMFDDYLCSTTENYYSNSYLYASFRQLISCLQEKEGKIPTQWKLRQEFVQSMLALVFNEEDKKTVDSVQDVVRKKSTFHFDLDFRLFDWNTPLHSLAKWSSKFTSKLESMKAAFKKLIDNKLAALQTTQTTPNEFLQEIEKFWEFCLSELLIKEGIGNVAETILSQKKVTSSPEATFFPSFDPSLFDFRALFLHEQPSKTPYNFSYEKTKGLWRVLEIFKDLKEKKKERSKANQPKDISKFV